MAKKETEEEKKAREFVEATAQALVDMASGVRAILNGKLNKRAVIALIAAATPRNSVSKEQIERVLDTLSTLDKTYTR